MAMVFCSVIFLNSCI